MARIIIFQKKKNKQKEKTTQSGSLPPILVFLFVCFRGSFPLSPPLLGALLIIPFSALFPENKIKEKYPPCFFMQKLAS